MLQFNEYKIIYGIERNINKDFISIKDQRKRLIEQIFEKIHREGFAEAEIENYTQIFVDLFANLSKGNFCKELVCSFFSENNLTKIFELFEIQNEIIIKNTSILLQSLINFQKIEIIDNCSVIIEKEKNQSEPYKCFLSVLEENLPALIERIFDINQTEKPFGLGRIELLKCFDLIINLKKEEINKFLTFHHFIPRILVI